MTGRIIHFNDLTKIPLEKFRDQLDKLELGGATVHKQSINLRIFLNWVVAQDKSDEIKIPSDYKIQGQSRIRRSNRQSEDQFFEFYNKDLRN